MKLNIGWLCNPFDTCERRGQILQLQSTEFENYIYIAFPVSLVIITFIELLLLIISFSSFFFYVKLSYFCITVG